MQRDARKGHRLEGYETYCLTNLEYAQFARTAPTCILSLCSCEVLAHILLVFVCGACTGTCKHTHTHTNGVGEGRTGVGEEIEYLKLTRKEDTKERKEVMEQVRGKGSG